jgi:ABC-2 type transport system permease protein
VAWLYLRLKARLIRNRLRKAGGWATLAFIGIWSLALGVGSIMGILGGVVARLVGGEGTAALFTLAGIAWLVGPVAAAALDETIEPRRLELLPITPAQMSRGLLVASLLGPGALVTILFVTGAVVGSSPDWLSLIPSVAAGASLVIWCLASARWVTTLLTDLLRSRAGRDIAVVGAAVLGGGMAFASTFLSTGNGDPLPALTGFGKVAVYLPPGALGRSLGLLADGEWVLGLALLVYGWAAIALVMIGWQRSLFRLSTRAPGRASERVARAGHTPLVPRLLSGWPGPQAATAGKELRYLRRDPRFRSQAVGLAVALAALGLGAGRSLFGTEYSPFLSVIVAWMAASTTGFNQFGFDDRSFWAYLVTGVELRRVLLGKNLAVVLMGLPVLVLVAIVMAVLVGDARHLLSAVLAGAAILAVWLAVGNVVSVLGAYPLPESNLFGSRNVSGSALFASLGGLLAAGLLSLPVAALVVAPLLLWGALPGVVGAAMAVVVGVLVHRLSLRVAGSLLESRSLHLLEVLDKPPV